MTDLVRVPKSDQEEVFDRLTVLRSELRGITGRRQNWCLCRCLCGTEKWIRRYSLVNGDSRSCGCLHIEICVKVGKASRTHGESRCSAGHRAEYRTWEGMIKRCYNPTHDSYPRYGGAGVTVFDKWRLSYEAFLAYVGRKPSPSHSIDRYPNSRGNYEPGNVRWATPKQQQRNRPDNIIVEFQGRSQTSADWEDELGYRRGIISGRIRQGMSIDRAMTQKVRRFANRKNSGK